MSIPCQRPNIYIIHRQGLFHGRRDQCNPYIEYQNNHYYYYDANDFSEQEYRQFYSTLNNMNSRIYYELPREGWFELTPSRIGYTPITIDNPSVASFLEQFNNHGSLGSDVPPPVYIPTGVTIFEITTIYE